MMCAFSHHFVNSNALKVCAASRVQNIYQFQPQQNDNTILQPQEKFAWQIDIRISKSNQILLIDKRIKIQVGISV